MEQEGHVAMNTVMHIHWRPSIDDFLDNPNFFHKNRSQRIYSNTVAQIRYTMEVKLKDNSIKKQLYGPSYKEACVSFTRATSSTTLKACNIHGILFFVDEEETLERLACKSFNHSFQDGENGFCFDIDVSRVRMEEEPPYHIRGYFTVDYPSPGQASDLQASFASCQSPEVHKLSVDFKYLLEEGGNPFTDITLKCGGVDLPAHRNILAARSPVFKAMLRDNNNKESQTGVIKIDDIPPETVKSMLRFIYCARIEELDEIIACDLLYAADKYELLDLKQMCVSHLKSVVSDANVFHILGAAVTHDEDLKMVVVDHIGKNFTAIEQSEDWKNLKKQNPDLVMDILTKIVKFK